MNCLNTSKVACKGGWKGIGSQTSLDKLWPIQPSLDQIGQVWASFGPNWTSLHLYHNLPVIFFELLAAKVASKCGWKWIRPGGLGGYLK